MAAIETYRVEKDGVSFYIQKEMVPYYSENGYRVFKSFEREIDQDGEPIDAKEGNE